MFDFKYFIDKNNILEKLKYPIGIFQKPTIISDELINDWSLILNNLNENEFERSYFHLATQKNYSLKEVLGMYAWYCNHHLAHIHQSLKFENQF